MQPKLRDIAKDLGVSTATVSNALSGNGRVSAQLRDRIRAKATAMAYSPSLQGRALRTGRSGVIGLVLPDISNPLFPAFAQSIEAAAEKVGYGVLIADSHGNAGDQNDALQRMMRQGADGIVIIPRRGTRMKDIGLPVAVVDTPSTPENSVSADHKDGGRIAARHLQGLGHRKIALVADSRNSSVQNDRIDGMKEAMNPDTEFRVIWLEDNRKPGFLSLVSEGFTGFIATSDLHALTALTQFQRGGISVPDQVSVMGFDDLAFSAAITPSLTTLAQDTDQIATQAVASLTAQIDGRTPLEKTVVPMKLIGRDSTKAAPET